jgi:hypothetical protein
MKRTLGILAAMTIAGSTSAAIIFTEDMGAPSGTTAIAVNSFENSGTLTYSGTGDIRITSVSTTDRYATASGGGNVFLTTGGTIQFIISGIDSTGYLPGSYGLSFGLLKSTTTSTVADYLALDYSTNGSTWSPITVPAQPTGTGTAIWRLVALTDLNLPQSETLSLRWMNTAPGGSGAAATQFRVDDVSLSAIPEPAVAGMLLLSGMGLCILSRHRKYSA